MVDAMGKDRALARLVEMENPSAALIFANRRSEVEYLTRYLQNSGYDADGISSDLTQKAREDVMGRLRAGRLRLLIATDVAARGIDVADLSHVFQYDVPQDREYYVHRAGRTARAGKAGASLVLVTRPELPAMKEIAER
jgi:ATP-dependent RNA helicase DeaD